MGKHKAEDCMFIDDNLSFASTASMLGMHGVWLNITGERKELPLGVTEIKSLTDLSNDSRLFQEGVL